MLGQGTTRGESHVMTLTTTAGQPMPAPGLRCALIAEPRSAHVARHLVRDCFEGRLNAGVVDDVDLVVAELVANAVAAMGNSGAVQIGAWIAGSDVAVEVVDGAGGAPRQPVRDPFSEDGRGLLLVAGVTRAWGWAPFAGGKAVWGLVPAL